MMAGRARGTVVATVIVPIVATVLAAVASAWAGKSYDGLMAHFYPDKISGDYVVLASNNGPSESNVPPTEDVLSLQSHDGVVSGTGQRGNKRWIYSGYLKNGYVVLSYRSADSTGIGFGTFFLTDPTGDAREYVGYIDGNVCPERRVLRCNAVVVKGNPSGPEETSAKITYASKLNAQCAAISAFGETSTRACGL